MQALGREKARVVRGVLAAGLVMASGASACSALLDIPEPILDPSALDDLEDAGDGDEDGTARGADDASDGARDAGPTDATHSTDALDAGGDSSAGDGAPLDGGPLLVVVPTDNYRPNAMAAYGDDILFASERDGDRYIYRVPRDGHLTPVIVASVPAFPRGISVDQDDVCFTTTGVADATSDATPPRQRAYVGCISRADLDAGLAVPADAGGSVRILASSSRPSGNDPDFYRIASNGTSAFWTDSYPEGYLHHVLKVGGAPQENCLPVDGGAPLSFATNKFSDIRFIGADLYVAGHVDGVLKIVGGTCSGTVEPLNTTGAFAFAVADSSANPVHTVWTDYLPNGTGTVRSSLVGNGLVPIRDHQEGARDIVIDGVNVYWVLAGPVDSRTGLRTMGSVVTCDYRNCQPRTLASGLVEAKTLLSIGDSVYVAVTGYQSIPSGRGDRDGKILRIPKVP